MHATTGLCASDFSTVRTLISCTGTYVIASYIVLMSLRGSYLLQLAISRKTRQTSIFKIVNLKLK